MIAKRAMDLMVALLGLVVLSPLLLVIAVAVRLSSPGPVFFRQVRVGLRGKHFTILKFRTMIRDAVSAGPGITVNMDPRITAAGRFLRRSKLDELPQLINVLVGEMSLVGPRPEVPRFVEHYPPALAKTIFSVKPGLTDLASIEFIDEDRLLTASADPEQLYVQEILPRKWKYCVEYVSRQSLGLDLWIIIQTVSRIVSR